MLITLFLVLCICIFGWVSNELAVVACCFHKFLPGVTSSTGDVYHQYLSLALTLPGQQVQLGDRKDMQSLGRHLGQTRKPMQIPLLISDERGLNIMPIWITMSSKMYGVFKLNNILRNKTGNPKWKESSDSDSSLFHTQTCGSDWGIQTLPTSLVWQPQILEENKPQTTGA